MLVNNLEIYGILAYPAKHSLSPAMQQAAFDALQINAQFRRFEIKPAELKEFMQSFEGRGLAVSLPHKENIIPLLDKADEVATEIGAVNTVYLKDGKLCGTNTDYLGFQQAVGQQNITNKKCAIIGAGGVAKAILFALQAAKTVTIFNRTAGKLNSKPLSEFQAKNFDLVINATSVGLNNFESPLSKNIWQDFEGVAFDSVYIPKITKFLTDAKSAGGQIETGDKMLLYQGVAQFELWTGQKAPISLMQKALAKALVEGV